MDKNERASQGGHARAAKLTPEQRSASARKAVNARWAKARRQKTYTATVSNAHALTYSYGRGLGWLREGVE